MEAILLRGVIELKGFNTLNGGHPVAWHYWA